MHVLDKQMAGKQAAGSGAGPEPACHEPPQNERGHRESDAPLVDGVVRINGAFTANETYPTAQASSTRMASGIISL
jgi:hypothetical protein